MEIEAMNHSEAVQQMATERYLLDELSPDLRDAFEEHMFDCPECALDVRTAAAFVQEAKVQLPELTGPAFSPATATNRPKATETKAKNPWRFWQWRPVFTNPAFAAPVFAALLVIVGYQNLVTYPALRMAANEPRLAPTVFLHSGSRGAAHTPVDVDRKQGTALLIDTPPHNGYASFLFELRDPQGKLALHLTAPIDASQNSGQDGRPEGGAADGTLSLAIPSAGLQEGAYTLVISGVAASGERTEIERQILDFHIRS
jgi:hypothetical protein